MYSTHQRLSVQIIHSRLKLKEKTQWWINYHFIEIDSSFEKRLASQRKEKKISIKLMIQNYLFDDLIEFLKLKRINQMKKMKFINWKTQFNTNKLSFKTIKLKRFTCLQLISFILKLLISSFLSLWNKNDEISELIISE